MTTSVSASFPPAGGFIRKLGLALTLLGATLAHAAPGDADLRFGARGVLDLTAASGQAISANDTGVTIAHGVGGTTYVGGGVWAYLAVPTVGNSFVARVTADGRLDNSLVGKGYVKHRMPANSAMTDFISVLPSGRVMYSEFYEHWCGVLCPADAPAPGRFVSAFNEQGTEDFYFTPGQTLIPSTEVMPLRSVVAFRGGRVVALTRNPAFAGGFGVYALTPDARRDDLFEGNVKGALACGPTGAQMTSLVAAVDRQDRLVIAAAVKADPASTALTTCVLRLNQDGTRDNTFGRSGVADFDGTALRAYTPARIAFAAGGAIRLALKDASTVEKSLASAAQLRLTASGQPDASIDGAAVITFDTPLAYPLSAIEPLADGRTLLAGFRPQSGSAADTGRTAIVVMNGRVPDTGFGAAKSGIVSLANGIGQQIVPQAISVAPDGGIYVLGPMRGVADPFINSGLVLARFEGVPLSSTAAGARYEGLWWRHTESGWGVGLSQQGESLFAAWFTYDLDGKGMWLVMPNGVRAGESAFSGKLYRTTGPAFNSQPFDSTTVFSNSVGSATFDFADANSASFTYTVGGITQTKSITRQVFGTLPTCGPAPFPGATVNYQGLWWNAPAGSESGWGLYLSHQGDTIFGAWFTYNSDRNGQWLVMPSATRAADGTYKGTLYRTLGPAFSLPLWNPSAVVSSAVGTAELSFANADNGQFRYTLDGITQTKSITRQVFASPVTVCH